MATTVAVHASLSSLDLIEPLGKSDEFNFVSIRETYNNKYQDGVDTANEIDGAEELFLPELQQIKHSSISVPIQDSETSGQQNHDGTTLNHKLVLTKIKTDGYIHTQLLSCAHLQTRTMS